MEKQICQNCIHYRRHYTLDKRKIFRVHCGHCTLHKQRRKNPDSIACPDYIFTPPDEDAFASKEYLSKTLLQYVLNLELLPNTEDAPK